MRKFADAERRAPTRQLGVSSRLYWLSHAVVDLAVQAAVTTFCLGLLGAVRGLGDIPVLPMLALVRQSRARPSLDRRASPPRHKAVVLRARRHPDGVRAELSL